MILPPKEAIRNIREYVDSYHDSDEPLSEGFTEIFCIFCKRKKWEYADCHVRHFEDEDGQLCCEQCLEYMKAYEPGRRPADWTPEGTRK